MQSVILIFPGEEENENNLLVNHSSCLYKANLLHSLFDQIILAFPKYNFYAHSSICYKIKFISVLVNKAIHIAQHVIKIPTTCLRAPSIHCPTKLLKQSSYYGN